MQTWQMKQVSYKFALLLKLNTFRWKTGTAPPKLLFTPAAPSLRDNGVKPRLWHVLNDFLSSKRVIFRSSV